MIHGDSFSSRLTDDAIRNEVFTFYPYASLPPLVLETVLDVPMITLTSSSVAGSDISPEKSKALFQAHRAWVKYNYQRRLELLQSQQSFLMPQNLFVL
tara:strand:- start:731 stop:1024 length:294 start_codon:yes stop_codon:yes gene_type:complete